MASTVLLILAKNFRPDLAKTSQLLEKKSKCEFSCWQAYIRLVELARLHEVNATRFSAELAARDGSQLLHCLQFTEDDSPHSCLHVAQQIAKHLREDSQRIINPALPPLSLGLLT